MQGYIVSADKTTVNSFTKCSTHGIFKKKCKLYQCDKYYKDYKRASLEPFKCKLYSGTRCCLYPIGDFI